MATAQQRELKHAIAVISEWDESAPDQEVAAVFSDLMELDQEKDKELWNKFKSSLASNKDLESPRIRSQISQPILSWKGYWWWNPKNWN